MEWLDESEKSLDSEVEIANDPDKIKTQLSQHKVTERPLITAYWRENESLNHLQQSLIMAASKPFLRNLDYEIFNKPYLCFYL